MAAAVETVIVAAYHTGTTINETKWAPSRINVDVFKKLNNNTYTHTKKKNISKKNDHTYAATQTSNQ